MKENGFLSIPQSQILYSPRACNMMVQTFDISNSLDLTKLIVLNVQGLQHWVARIRTQFNVNSKTVF